MKKIFLFVLIALLLVGCGDEKPKQEPHFGMDVKTFIQKYNEANKDAKDPVLLITNPQTQEGKFRKVYRHSITPNCQILIGENNQTKMVDRVGTVFSPKDMKTIAYFMAEQTAIVAVLHPDIPKENRLDVLKKLKVIGNNNLKGLSEITTVGKVKYEAVEENGNIQIMAIAK